MREKKPTDMHLKRCGRRAVLAAMLAAAGTPAIADDATPRNMRGVPPLPFSVAAPNGHIQQNPFCDPVLAPTSDPVIRLAADHVPSVRLRPIGAAVGLRSIGESDAPMPIIDIATPQHAGVQQNPLIGSTHHDEAELSDVAVTDASDRLATERGDEAPAPVNVFVDTAPRQVPVVVPEISADAPPTADAPSDAIVGETEAISFSLSDLDPETEQEPAAAAAPPVPSAPPIATLAPPTTDIGSLAEPAVVAEPLVPIDFADAPALRLQPTRQPAAETAQSPSGSSPVTGVVSSQNRYRPPVAVTPPPLAFVRGETADDVAIIRPAVTRVEAIDLGAVDDAAAPAGQLDPGGQLGEWKIPDDAALTDLYMTKAQVRSLTIGGAVRQVAVDDCEVCQAVSAGPSELKLIGTGNGVTRLAVWADAGSGGEPKVRVFQIHVEEGVDATGGSVGSKTDTLNQSIARAFPECRVQVRQENGQLIVAGNCDSKRSAGQIIRMVRKTCLIPVIDELQIR